MFLFFKKYERLAEEWEYTPATMTISILSTLLAIGTGTIAAYEQFLAEKPHPTIIIISYFLTSLELSSVVTLRWLTKKSDARIVLERRAREGRLSSEEQESWDRLQRLLNGETMPPGILFHQEEVRFFEHEDENVSLNS
jgi:hypothetical protein